MGGQSRSLWRMGTFGLRPEGGEGVSRISSQGIALEAEKTARANLSYGIMRGDKDQQDTKNG